MKLDIRSGTVLALVASIPVLLAGCRTAGAAIRDDSFSQEADGQDDADQPPDELGEFDEFDEFGEFGEFGEFDIEEPKRVFDPLHGYNRLMHGFNDRVYTWIWDPIARGYRYVVPQPVRVALNRAFDNLRAPPRIINSLLQLKFEKAFTELGRMLVNTTVGILGLFDVADSYLGWRAPSPEDFGQTLATYGVGSGFPVVLPFLGPSNVRDGLSLFPDGYMNPAFYYLDTAEGIAVWTANELNYTSLHIGEYESLKSDALDSYTLFRDVYELNRQNKIEE